MLPRVSIYKTSNVVKEVDITEFSVYIVNILFLNYMCHGSQDFRSLQNSCHHSPSKKCMQSKAIVACTQVIRHVPYGKLPGRKIGNTFSQLHMLCFLGCPGEIFGHNRSRSQCCQVQPVMCSDLSDFLYYHRLLAAWALFCLIII